MNSFMLLVGTSRMYLFADFMLIYDLTVGRIFRPVTLKHPSKTFFVLVGLLAISAILSPVTLAQTWQTVLRLLTLGYLLPNYKIRFNKYSQTLIVILLAVALWQLLFVEISRPHGHHMNATLFGMFGFSIAFYFFWPVAVLGGSFLAFSGSRVLLGAMWIFVLFERSKRATFLAVIYTITFLVVMLTQSPERLTVDGISSAVELRFEMATEISQEQLDAKYDDLRCGERSDPEFSFFGYGFGGYCYATGQPTPHNSYLLSIYELGMLLTVPFWILIFLLARKIRLKVWLPLVLMAFFTDDLFFTPEGIYVIALWLVSLKVFESEVMNVRTNTD